MRRRPSFQFYPADWLSSQRVKLMSNSERGIYIQLLAHDWLNFGLPLDVENLSKLADEPLESFKKSWLKIENCFYKKDGKLHNERLRQERKKQNERSLKMKENAEKLWRTPSKQKHKSTSCKTYASPHSFSSSSSSSVSVSSSNTKTEEESNAPPPKRFKPPTPDEVEVYALTLGYVLDGERFCDHYGTVGWKRKGEPIKDWRGCVRTWKRNDSKFGSNKKRMAEIVAGVGEDLA